MSENATFLTNTYLDGDRVDEKGQLRVELFGAGARNVSMKRLVEVIKSDVGWDMLCELMGYDV